MMERQLIDEDSIIDYDSLFLTKEEADSFLTFLKENVSWEQIFYTKYRNPQPRLTAWYADKVDMAYSYSGITQTVQVWLPELLILKKKIEDTTKVEYNSVLLNFYRDGTDSIGAHADNEKELGINPNIASISLGATREFILQNKNNSLSYQLTHGSLLVMSGAVQQNWKHSIPKVPSLKEGRINLTFRKFSQ
jgi:alkylated DNA repair dioxygenase AlkB